MPAFILQFAGAHRARYHDSALQRQGSSFDAAMQVLGHEAIAGEDDLLCYQAAVCGFQSMHTILLMPAEHFAVGMDSGAPAFGGCGQAECIS